MNDLQYNEIGYWPEIKLDIVRTYAQAYSAILSKDTRVRKHIYIEVFAGPGVPISMPTGQFEPGSPLNALNVQPPFSEYHFVDLDGDKAEHLRHKVGDAPNVSVYHEDCNSVLLEKVFPRARYEDYHRALCLLDPYALNLDWEVVQAAGQTRTTELFLNFMVLNGNANALWKNPDSMPPAQLARMDAFWGDRSWRNMAFQGPPGRLPDSDLEEKVCDDAVAAAFQERLKKAADFAYVPEPLPLRNTRGAIVYYLFFAAPNRTGAKIVAEIFNKYRD